MKKSIICFVVFLLFFLCGCATNNGSASGENDYFIENYDEVKDITFITHKDLEVGYFYNLRDSLTGERENITLYISGKNLIIAGDYQYSDWMFINGIVIFDSEKNRLEISSGSRSGKVVSGKTVREHYGAILHSDEVEKLKRIISSESVYIAFIGKPNTDKLEIKPKHKDAILATIKKWESLN